MSILQRGKYSNPSHVSTAWVASEPSSKTFKSATIALAKLSAIRGAAVLSDGHSRQTTGERQVERMDDEVRRNVVDAGMSILRKIARRIRYEPPCESTYQWMPADIQSVQRNVVTFTVNHKTIENPTQLNIVVLSKSIIYCIEVSFDLNPFLVKVPQLTFRALLLHLSRFCQFHAQFPFLQQARFLHVRPIEVDGGKISESCMREKILCQDFVMQRGFRWHT